MIFGGGINKELTKEILGTLPKRDQNTILQNLYDKGYSVPDIAKATDINQQTLYTRVDAHRGRKNNPEIA